VNRRAAIGRAVRLLIAVGASSIWPAVCHAESRCPTPDGASAALGSVDPTRRLTWIDAHLTATEKTARLWTYGWGGGIAAAGVGSLVAVPFVAHENRVDWYTGAVSAAVGVAAFVFAPPAVLHDAPALRADIAKNAARAAPDADVCALLAGAEARLVHDAQDQKQQRRWYIHVGNLVFNAGLGLFLGFGYHHWSAGAINALAGAAVGEALIFTSPTSTIDDLSAYRTGAL
jgi:hypothetical protein